MLAWPADYYYRILRAVNSERAFTMLQNMKTLGASLSGGDAARDYRHSLIAKVYGEDAANLAWAWEFVNEKADKAKLE